MINSGTIGGICTVITPSDTGNLSFTALYIGTAGNLTITTAQGNQTVTFANVPVGFFPIAGTRVWNTGTAAGNIVGIS